MSDIDDLAEIIRQGMVSAEEWGMDHRDIAADIIAAGFHRDRTITTVEELDALPEKSVVLDRQHDVAEKHSGRLLYRETRNMPLEYLATHYGPFIVLHEGARDE